MFEKFKKYNNKKYNSIAMYVAGTALVVFTLCLFIYWLSGKLGNIWSFTNSALKPLILGLIFTYLLSPLTQKLEDKVLYKMQKPKGRRLVAVLITFIIVFMVITLILSIIIATVTKSLSVIDYKDVKDMMMSLYKQFENFRDTIEQALSKTNINAGSFTNFLGKVFGGVKSAASTILFALIFSVYFLYDRSIGKYWGGVLRAVSSESTREKLAVFASDANKVFSGYIRGQSLDALLVGVISSVALLIAGVPYAMVIGILTGLGNLIPYVGPIIGFASLAVVCLAEGAITKLIIGGVILAVVMFIDGNVIGPKVLSSSVEVHPVLVIVALLAGGNIGGIVGMLVSVPVAALIKIEFEKYMIAKRNYDPASYKKDDDEAESKKDGEDK